MPNTSGSHHTASGRPLTGQAGVACSRMTTFPTTPFRQYVMRLPTPAGRHSSRVADTNVEQPAPDSALTRRRGRLHEKALGPAPHHAGHCCARDDGGRCGTCLRRLEHALAGHAARRLDNLGCGKQYGQRLPAPLWDKLAADGHPLDFVGTGRGGSMSDPDNEGHPGYKIHQIAELADASLTRYRPNVVTLMIGTNDLNESYPGTTASRRRSRAPAPAESSAGSRRPRGWRTTRPAGARTAGAWTPWPRSTGPSRTAWTSSTTP